MVRKYKRKPGRVNPDKRMARAAELRAQGLSLRVIGGQLVCSYETVRLDLVRWDREHANVVSLSKTPVKNPPHGGEKLTPDFDSTPTNIIELRRKRA